MTKPEYAICLLLIIAVIPCAAAVSSKTSNKARMMKSLNNAKQIVLGLRAYAGDHKGSYPTGKNANECLAKVVPLFETEKIFHVKGSAWHGKGKFKDGPDNLWEKSKPKAGKALEPGENAYAYTVGLKDNSPARFPLLASGFSKEVGTYSKDVNKIGGVWGGNKCVTIYADGYGKILELNEDAQAITDVGENLFLEFGGDKKVKMLNPEAPKDSKSSKTKTATKSSGE